MSIKGKGRDARGIRNGNTWSLALLAAVALVLAAAPVVRPADAAEVWTVRDVGMLGDEWVYPKDLDDSGRVAGDLLTPGGDWRAFLLDGGRAKNLGVLPGGDGSFGHAVNESGQVAGVSAFKPSAQVRVQDRAFLYSNGQMQNLGTLGRDSAAHDAGNTGIVVGESEAQTGTTSAGNPVYRSHAFSYHNGEMTDLGTLPGGATSAAEAVNDAGQVTGTSDSGEGYRAFVYQDGRMSSLGTLPGGSGSDAFDINAGGQVVGRATSPAADHNRRPFLWEDGQMRDLGALPGFETADGQAGAINDAGQIVGHFEDWENDESAAFLWEEGRMTDLDTLLPAGSGWTFAEAYAINGKGQILGAGEHDGVPTSFLLSPPGFDGDDDGVPDASDGCPDQPANTPDGCPPPPDGDGDGVPDASDACPSEPADTPDGCPPDTTAPSTSITSAPPKFHRYANATLAWSGDDGRTPGSRLLFSYKLDGGDWSPYSAEKSVEFSDLAAGGHTFSARARDAAGNVDATPAVRFWTVDKRRPTVGDLSPTKARAATPTFSLPVRDDITRYTDANISRHVRVYVNGVRQKNISYADGKLKFKPPKPLSTRKKNHVRSEIHDAAGNGGAWGWVCVRAGS